MDILENGGQKILSIFFCASWIILAQFFPRRLDHSFYTERFRNLDIALFFYKQVVNLNDLNLV